MTNKFKVGDEFVGFKFIDTYSIMYDTDMDNYVGKKGKIVKFDIDRNIQVQFDDGENWMYPYPGQAIKDVHKDIQSLKDKYPQYRFTITVEDNL